MEILQLRYFYTVARTLNISRAAHIHGIPQPAMSRTISRLEVELNTQLFTREKNHLALTKAGQRFYEEISRSLDHLDRGINALEEQPKELSGELRLFATIHRMTLIDCMVDFRAKYPKVTYSVVNNPNAEGNFDLCIADENLECRFDSKCLLLNEPMSIAVPRKNPLAQKKVLTIQDLRGVPFIMQSRNHAQFERLQMLARNEGFSLDLVAECSDLCCIQLYLAADMGVTLHPSIAWKGFCEDEVIPVPLNIPFSRDVYLYWNRNTLLANPVAAAFKERVEAHYRSLSRR